MRDGPAVIIFDFDGVIVDSEPLHLRGFVRTLAEVGIELGEAEYFRELIGFDDRGAFRHIYGRRDRPLDEPTFEHLLSRKSAFVRELMRDGDYEALPGAVDLVRGIFERWPLAICSGALRDEIETMLSGVGLRDCFPTIIAAEDVDIGKPDPQGYLLTLRRLAERVGRPIEPSEALVIEDAPSVIRAIKPLGFRTLGVATSHSIEALYESEHAVPRLDVDLIDRLFSGPKVHA